MNSRLKEIIFDKLYKDLSNVEIIHHGDSIWFINRENKYWCLEYQKSGALWWRYHFFMNFFSLFSMKSNGFESIISEWVEEVLNCKVKTTQDMLDYSAIRVEEVLNCKVKTTKCSIAGCGTTVEEVLNCKVKTILTDNLPNQDEVEKVLNYKVKTIQNSSPSETLLVEEVLNHKVNQIKPMRSSQGVMIKYVLGDTD